MGARTKNRIKVVNDTALLLSVSIAFLTGLLKIPLLADSMSQDLYRSFQELPWGVLNFLHDWCGVVALCCVMVHLSLSVKRYVWLLKKGWNHGR
jgi:hypothetical protein